LKPPAGRVGQWITMERSRGFNGGYPSIINMDGWIPRFSSGWMDYPLNHHVT